MVVIKRESASSKDSESAKGRVDAMPFESGFKLLDNRGDLVTLHYSISDRVRQRRTFGA
jgi:hypothetical protein